MSLILDALKKSEADRQRSQAPTITTTHQPLPIRNRGKKKTPTSLWISLGALSLTMIIGLMALPWLLENAGIQVNQPPQQSASEEGPALGPPREDQVGPEDDLRRPGNAPLIGLGSAEDQSGAVGPASPAQATRAEAAGSGQLETFRMGRLEQDQAPEPQRHSRDELETRQVSEEEKQRLSALQAMQRAQLAQREATTRTPPTTAEIKEPPTAQLSALPTAEDHLSRGWSSVRKGLFNQAIADFNRAAKLEPGFADVYFARGWALEKQGLYADAIADYDRHLRAKPGNPDALLSRGVLYTYKGDFDAAANDFAQAFRWAGAELRPYIVLWLYVARERSGVSGMDEFERLSLGLNSDVWPGVLVDLFLGAATPEDVIAAANQGNAQTQMVQRCVGEYFLGQYFLLGGDERAALEHFQAAVASGATDYRQYHAAIKEIDRLKP